MSQNQAKVLKQDEIIFRDASVRSAVFTMAIPTIIGQLIVLFYNLADTFFIGRTGDPQMVAGVSLILPIFNVSNALAAVTGLGGGTLISRLLGANKREEASYISSFTFLCIILMGLVWSLLVFFFMHDLLIFLGASPSTYIYAKQYAMCVVVIGTVPTVLQLTCAHLIRAIGYSKKASFGISLGGILNVIFDPLFMFVLLPKGNEIIGAGIATLLSNIIALGYFLITIYKLRDTSVLNFSFLKGLKLAKNKKELFTNGIPGGISNLLFDLSQLMINKLMSYHGDIPLASIGIILKAERIPLSTGIGICQGIVPIVAYNYAAGNKKRMIDVINFSRLFGLIVAAVSILIYVSFSFEIMSIFIDHQETVQIGSDFLRARTLATPFMFMAFHIAFILLAINHGKVTFKLSVIRQIFLYIPILYVMDYCFGMYGLVWAQLISDIITDVISFIWLHKIFRKIN